MRTVRMRTGFGLLMAALASAAGWSALAQAAPDINLELRIDRSPAAFHIGEVIPVKLVFSSDDHAPVIIGEDCIGRGAYKFHVTPPGFVSRESEMDAAGLGNGSGMCHGWPGQANDLARKPYEVGLDLNNYFRMETPGHYKVTVTTSRVATELASNAVDVEILPRDVAWEKQQLARAVGKMSTREIGGAADACKALSDLDTEDAELAMAQSYRAYDYCDQTFYMALINARNRRLVLDTMEAGIAQTDRAIREGYLSLLAKISLYQQHPDWYPQPEPEDAQPSPAQERHSRSALWRTPGAVHIEELRYAGMLTNSVAAKTGVARAVSVETLLDLDDTFMGDQVPAQYAQVAREQLPSVFLSLPIMDQDRLLQRDWPFIATPPMVPVLKQVVNENGGPRGLALQRLTELSPEDARPLILDGLRSGTPYQYWEISELPDKELPELDSALLNNLKQQLPMGYYVTFYAPYLSRYASAAIESDVKALIEGKIGTLSGNAEACIVAYLLRVDPPVGRQFLRQELARPAAGFLENLAEFTTPHESERAALAALDNPDPPTVYRALMLLQRYGSAENKALLLAHFRAWNQNWQQHPEQLTSQGNYAAANLEGGYLNALAMPQMWLPSVDAIRGLAHMCVRQDCKDRAAQMAESATNTHFNIGYGPAVFISQKGGMFTVGQFNNIIGIDELKQKLEQYPNGTGFTVKSTFGGYAQTQRVYEDLLPLAVEHGFKLSVEQRKQFGGVFISMF